MKKIYKYKSLGKKISNKLKNENFRFLNFDEKLGKIEILTIEEDNRILAYAILKKATDLRKNYYEDLIKNLDYDIYWEKFNIEALKEEIIEPDTTEDDENYFKEELEESKNKLDVFIEALDIYNKKEFYYLIGMEAVPCNEGNGTLLFEYIKNNYKNIVMIVSGCEENRDKSLEFFKKQGFTHSNCSSMLLNNKK